jgi:hypothetical protein
MVTVVGFFLDFGKSSCVPGLAGRRHRDVARFPLELVVAGEYAENDLAPIYKI